MKTFATFFFKNRQYELGISIIDQANFPRKKYVELMKDAARSFFWEGYYNYGINAMQKINLPDDEYNALMKTWCADIFRSGYTRAAMKFVKEINLSRKEQVPLLKECAFAAIGHAFSLDGQEAVKHIKNMLPAEEFIVLVKELINAILRKYQPAEPDVWQYNYARGLARAAGLDLGNVILQMEV